MFIDLEEEDSLTSSFSADSSMASAENRLSSVDLSLDSDLPVDLPLDTPSSFLSTEVDSDVFPLTNLVEAILFAAKDPLKLSQIAKVAGDKVKKDLVKDAIDELNVFYLNSGRSFEIVELAGRYQLLSRPEYSGYLSRLYPRSSSSVEKDQKLTPALLDTLAIIAYRQPVTRGEIEYIRGVGCGSAVRFLLERGLVKISGRRTDVLGQPLLYSTTDTFLVNFGLGSLDELPLRGEFSGSDLFSDISNSNTDK